MLVAEKQLLDANLRNELMVLRRMELKMLVSRYQTAIPAATLIVGFTFTSVVELEFMENHHPTWYQMTTERMFYAMAAVALAGSIYAMAVSSIAIVLGQRLAVQATANLTAKHDANVKELARKFVSVLVALMISLLGVVGAATCAIWVKADATVAAVSTILFFVIIPLILYSLLTMNWRLNDGTDEQGSLRLVADGVHQAVGEFRVGDKSSIPVDVEGGRGKPNERSMLVGGGTKGGGSISGKAVEGKVRVC